MPAYIGVNGKAKAIAKVYKGNSEGKAELIWGPKGFVRLAKNDIAKIPLDENCVGLGSCYGCSSPTSYVNTNCVFGGGGNGTSNFYNTVVSYDENLIQTMWGNLLCGGPDLAVAKIPKGFSHGYVFAPGYLGNYGPSYYSKYGKQITWYSDSGGTASKMGDLSSYRYQMGVTGFWSEPGMSEEGADAEVMSLSSDIATYAIESATEESYVVFAGGYNDENAETFKTVEAISKAQTRVSMANLTYDVYGPGATSIGDYVLIGGGMIGTDPSDDSEVSNANTYVNGYNASLTKVSVPNFITSVDLNTDTGVHSYCVGKMYPDATASKKYAIFGPSLTQSTCFNHYIDLYDNSLVHTYLDPCSMNDADSSGYTIYKPKVCVMNEYITITYSTYNDEVKMIVYDPDLVRLDDVIISTAEKASNIKVAAIGDKYILVPGLNPPYSTSARTDSSSAYYLWE